MISATRRWFRRNRAPIAIGIGVLGAGYVATQYVLGKISDARERMSSDRIARENLRRRFEQNQEDCTFTVLALLPTATDNILSELETERITFELQQQKAAKLAKNGEGHPSELGSGPPSVTDEDGKSIMSIQSESGVHASQVELPSATISGDGPHEGGQQSQRARRSKLQLWNDLKISAITRAFTLIYTLALLALLTRVQLNLLGRRSYLSSVVSLATGAMNESTITLENHDDDNPDQAYGNDFETNRKYLTFSWWLLHRGWREIMVKVQAAVKDVFSTLSPRDDITMERFSEMTLEVRKKVEGATQADRNASKWLPYLLPPRDQEEFVLQKSGMTLDSTSVASSTSTSSSGTAPLRRLLDETSDLVESPPFTQVLTLLLDAGFSMLVDRKVAQQSFKVTVPSDPPDLGTHRVQEIVDIAPVKLPIVLATLTRQAHIIGNGVPNEYLQAMEQVRDLEAFAAVVYSSNWENEVTPMMEGGVQETKGKDAAVETNLAASNDTMGQESIIDVGTTSRFENAWGKAVDMVDKMGAKA
ncbi:MAG: peroxin [Claussenomyces sp. TS43310]|nr:MAG: peroxin [Claussenomyces sp. TS43310]